MIIIFRRIWCGGFCPFGLTTDIGNWVGKKLRGGQEAKPLSITKFVFMGFITFLVWVCYKETSWVARVAWFVAIMLLGNIAMAAYCLAELFRAPPDGQLAAVVASPGRQPRSRVMDLLIAATAHAHAARLYTRNARGLVGIEHLIDIVAV